MGSTREIRRRIKGVKNIKQVTRAMNMIAAARLRRAQTKAEAARPYADRLSEILRDVQAGGAVSHPLLVKRAVRHIGLVLVTSDRGLCGSFNTNILREAARFLRDQSAETVLITVGRKGREHFTARGVRVDEHFAQPSRDVSLGELSTISHRVMTGYRTGQYDQVWLAYSQFVSVLKSTPVVMQLLPLEAPSSESREVRSAYQFEPAAESLLNTLLPQYVEVLVYRALVESLASEQAARMVAMQGATDSAEEMIENLTRDYNRARQGLITKQIMEVVSGAEALQEND